MANITDAATGKRLSRYILAAAAENPGIVNLDSDYKETKPQLRINVDTNRAGDLGVSVEEVSQALSSLLGSRRVSTARTNRSRRRKPSSLSLPPTLAASSDVRRKFSDSS